MPPARKHYPMNPVAHLRNAVAAHQMVQKLIADHAQREHDARQAAETRKAADAKLLNPVTRHGTPV